MFQSLFFHHLVANWGNDCSVASHSKFGVGLATVFAKSKLDRLEVFD